MGAQLFTLPPTEKYVLLGVIVGLVVLFRIVPLFFSSRGQPKTRPALGTPRNYGLAGGVICPHCHHPILLSLFGLKLGLGYKIVRCKFCGRWSIVRRRSLEELRAAEAAELAEAQPAQPQPAQSEAEKTKALLDESRFTDENEWLRA